MAGVLRFGFRITGSPALRDSIRQAAKPTGVADGQARLGANTVKGISRGLAVGNVPFARVSLHTLTGYHDAKRIPGQNARCFDRGDGYVPSFGVCRLPIAAPGCPG